jgi:DNA-directed RNA polymerase subunit RPC12/RpoP
MAKTQLECPKCGATRFTKQVVIEFPDGKEKTFLTEYACANCLAVFEKGDLRVREVAQVQPEEKGK